MATKRVDKKQDKRKDDSKLFALLSVLLSIAGFLIAYAFRKDDKYVMHYAKQSLVLFFGWILFVIVSMTIAAIPIIGMLVQLLIQIGLVLFWIIGLIYSLSGEMKEIPLVGEIAKKIKI